MAASDSAASAGFVRAAGASHAAAALSSVQRGSAARSGPGAPRSLQVSRASTAGLPWLGPGSAVLRAVPETFSFSVGLRYRSVTWPPWPPWGLVASLLRARPNCSGSRGCASRLRRSIGPAARTIRCVRRGIRRGWRHGTFSAAARCGAPPIALPTRPR